MDMKSVVRRKRKAKVGVAAASGNAAEARLVSIAKNGRGKGAKAERRNVVVVRNVEGAVREAEIVGSEVATEAHTLAPSLEVPWVGRWGEEEEEEEEVEEYHTT